MALLRQIVKGLYSRKIEVEGTADDLNALKSLMAGKIETYDFKNQVGTSAPYPEILNPIVFQTYDDTRRKRATVRIPHLKPSKSWNDLEPYVIGNFDCSYSLDVKSVSAKLIKNFSDTEINQNNQGG